MAVPARFPSGEPDRLGEGGLLGVRSRRARLLAAAVGVVLLTAGTVAGSDHDFPFGPFRMYATRDDPNGVVHQAVVLAVLSGGGTRDVTNTPGAPRRAELEGRLDQIRDNPAQFPAIARHYPHGAGVREIRLVWRSFPLHDGRSGRPTDAVVATWSTGGAS